MGGRGGAALTEAQEGLWYFQALDPANPILNTGQYLDLRGPLDDAALREAVGLPVHDIYSMTAWFHAGLRPRAF